MPPESKRVPPDLRREVAQRAEQLCEYCRCPAEFSADSFTIDHIQPRQLATQVVGQTPCGRATIEALSLNRPGVINLRRLLVSAGLHPPQ